MERRNFLYTASILTALSALPQKVFAADTNSNDSDPMQQFLLPAMTPLDHKGGMDIRVWVRSKMTNGLFSSVETAVAPKIMGPAPHYHKELDELMFVLEGTATVLVGDDVIEVEAGGWHLRPRMIKHTFWNASENPLRFIDMYFNQPFEDYLEKVFHEITPENGYPLDSEKRRNEMKSLAEKFGVMRYPDAQDERKVIISKYGLK